MGTRYGTLPDLATYSIEDFHPAESTSGELEEHASVADAFLSASEAPACRKDDRAVQPARGNGVAAVKEALLLLALLVYQTMHEGRCAMRTTPGKAGASARIAKAFCAPVAAYPARKAHDIPLRPVASPTL